MVVMNAKYSFFVLVLLVCQVLMVSTACPPRDTLSFMT